MSSQDAKRQQQGQPTAIDTNARPEPGRSPFARFDHLGYNYEMSNRETVGLTYAALRKECLDAVRHWPGCETVAGIQIIRDNTVAGFSFRVTLYGGADEKIANRAIKCVQREKQRYFRLMD